MTRSPATPQKSNKTFSNEASKVAVPYLDKLTASAKGKQPSPQGPSPASTYGDTAAGDSVPVTPLVASDHGQSAMSPRLLIIPSLAARSPSHPLPSLCIPERVNLHLIIFLSLDRSSEHTMLSTLFQLHPIITHVSRLHPLLLQPTCPVAHLVIWLTI